MTPNIRCPEADFMDARGLCFWLRHLFTAVLASALGVFSGTATAQQPVPASLLGEGVKQVVGGNLYTCALTSIGVVKCWGDNSNGQLGDGTTTSRSMPRDVSGLSGDVVSLAAGSSHTCALNSAGSVKCWGSNGFGQLGDGSTTRSGTPKDVSGLGSGVVSLAAGTYHTCAVTSAGLVKCWGSNGFGQLGDGTTTSRSMPRDVSGLSGGVVSLAAGSSHTCALNIAGSVKCWGSNGFGQLGDGSTTQSGTPKDVSGLGSGVVSLAAGLNHSCALTKAGAVKCWGSNDNGQLGDGTVTERSTPTDVSGLGSEVVWLAAGAYHTCALTSTGTVKCWGWNGFGQLGDGTITQRSTPTDVLGLGSDVVSLAEGYNHTCAVTSAGVVKCWGYNSSGQLGDGTTTIRRTTPTGVLGLGSGMMSLAAGAHHTCALTSAGAVKCWGDNVNGQLGDSTTIRRNSPTDVSGLGSDVVWLAAGEYHTCALTSTGTVKCWGDNGYGQLGDGTTIQRNTPIEVSGLGGGVVSLVAGGFHTCAVNSVGAVKCWGYNDAGQLGDGTTTQRSTPTDLSGLGGGVVSLASGFNHTCGVTSSGGIKCWGANSFGQLGDGTTTQHSTPMDVSGQSSGVVSLASGADHTCAVTSSGGVKCWGANSFGQLGDGTTTQHSTPTDVLGQSSGVMRLATGWYNTCALTSSDAVKCWGRNDYGQLGDGTTIQRTAPIHILASQAITFAPAVGPLSGASITLDANASSGLAVSFDTWTPDVCRIAGNVLTVMPDKGGFLCGVRALQPGALVEDKARYVAAPSRLQLLVVQTGLPQAPTSVTTTAGQRSITLTWAAPANDGGSPVTGYTVTGMPSDGGAQVGCTAPRALSCTVLGLDDGTAYTFVVTATNAMGQSPASSPASATTLKGNQTITFADPGGQTFGTTRTLSATASSGLTVVFTSSTSNVCTISPSGTLAFLTTGLCTIDADQSGNTTYNPAVTVSRSFSVNAITPGAPTIGTATPGNRQATVTFTPPVNSGGSAITGYTATANPGGATANGAVSPITVGGLTNGTVYTFTVTARTTAGTSAASGASNEVTPKGSQTITFSPPGDQKFGTAPTLSATAESGLTPTFTSGSPAVCMVTPGGLLTFLTVGPCTINADEAGDRAFNAAVQVSRTFSVLAQLAVLGTVPGMTGTATATLSGGGAGCTLASGTGFADPDSKPSGYAMPHGGFAFVASGCVDSVTLALKYPQALPVGVQFWKFGPATPGASTSTWFAWTGAALSADRRTVTYTVVDNGIGDADASTGTIRDPFAPALAAAPTGVASIPAMGDWGLMLTSLLAAGLGMLVLRRRTGC